MTDEVQGNSKPVHVGGLKKGNYVVLEGAACVVTDTQVSRPGKHGHAKVRLTGVGIVDDKKRVVVLPGHDSVDAPMIEKKMAQVLSIQGDMANVMDAETYETFDLKIPSELKEKIAEGATVQYWVVLTDKIMKQVQNG